VLEKASVDFSSGRKSFRRLIEGEKKNSLPNPRPPLEETNNNNSLPNPGNNSLERFLTKTTPGGSTLYIPVSKLGITRLPRNWTLDDIPQLYTGT
jgi:hypothetical protein